MHALTDSLEIDQFIQIAHTYTSLGQRRERYGGSIAVFCRLVNCSREDALYHWVVTHLPKFCFARVPGDAALKWAGSKN
jgi:hypothetical protein